MKKLLLALTMLSTPAFAADYIDSQTGFDGAEIHIKQIQQRDDKLTLVLEYENTSDDVIEVKGVEFDDVYYITGDKKYPILRDTNGNYVAAPQSSYSCCLFTRNTRSIEIKAKSKKVAWFKFEQPGDNDWPIEFVLPGAIPFVLEKPAN
ncbi:hypothetical protein F9L33_14460 [Amylibacter sp. SFDW26]|uniref:hypothetical protein n=1 Tax=Amylibacter sp. SFDW26 TaxID=2652722 RepID=UPI0012626DDA|nr:hypothetical protein [Amylibacter sp. SFDW26]KAB7610498.1 hypothetical protein F9L33_14460 [Amylibacter sp. SFDW26]